MAGTSTALACASEFGSFDLLADWAHQKYLEGFHTDAVTTAQHALALVDLTDDRTTPLYLHYTMGTAQLELGDIRQSALTARVLLSRVDPITQPYWQAKTLSLLAESCMRGGQMNRAMDALAQASALLQNHPSEDYNHLSASMAVAIALRAMYLYEEADGLLMGSLGTRSESVDLLVVDEAAQTLLYWAASRELIGMDDEARQLYIAVLPRAHRAMALARRHDSPILHDRSLIMEAFVLERLGQSGLAENRMRALMAVRPLRDEVLDGHLAHITLGRVHAERGEFAAARVALQAAQSAAVRAGRDVWAATALAALARVDELEFGDHPALGKARLLARLAMRTLWNDRESRFADIQARSRVSELLAETERMGQVVLEDPLTGLGNRRLLLNFIARTRDVVSAIFVDVDRFKDINDSFGHDIGDKVLQRVAHQLLTSCRSHDVVVRYGGDEFVVLVESDPVAAGGVADRVHRAVQEFHWAGISPELRVTASVGVATSQSGEAVLAAADKALYSAKRMGRDQVVSL